MTTLSENESILNNYETIELWNPQTLIKIMFADGLLKTTKGKIGGINTQYANEKEQMGAVLTKLFIKKQKPRAFTKEYLTELYWKPELFKNELKVQYEFCKSHKMGRVYPVNSLGYCTTRKEIRHTLCNGIYVDIDIENAHPNILNQLTNKQHTVLNDYCENRDKYFDILCSHYSLPSHGINYDWRTNEDTRDTCKELFISCILYNGLYISWETRNGLASQSPPDFYNELMSEMREIHRVLIEKNPEFYAKLQDSKSSTDYDNSEGALVSWVCQDSERKIQETKVAYLIKKKLIVKKNVVLCYDGEQIKYSNLIDDKLLRNIENEIMNANNFTLKLKLKGFENGFKPEQLDFEMPNENTLPYEMPILINYWKRLKNGEIFNINEMMEWICSCGVEYDFAMGFHTLYKDKFICENVENREWWEFKNNSWKNTQVGLRTHICSTYYEVFEDYSNEIQAKLINYEPNSKEYIEICKRFKSIRDNASKLKRTNDVNNITRELCNIHYKENFLKTFDRAINVLPLQSGLLFDMNTCETRPRIIDDKFTYECPVEYIIETEENKAEFDWVRKYFNDIFCGDKETEQVFIDVIKTTFSGKILRHLFICSGDGSNGKSSLFNVLAEIFGKSMDTISKKVIIVTNSNSHLNTEIEKLDKIRCGFVSELEVGDKLNEGVIKQISGGDKMNLRGICKTDITIIPTVTLFIAVNNEPEFKTEKAMLNRIINFPFNASFPVNKDFEETIMSMKSFIFSHIMLNGKIKHTIEPSPEMLEKKRQYVLDNGHDYLNDFIAEKITRNIAENGKRKNWCIKRNDFIKAYNEWCKEMDYKNEKLSPTKFTLNLKKMGITSVESHNVVWYENIGSKYCGDSDDEC